jgi:thiamine pyrophosphokinase
LKNIVIVNGGNDYDIKKLKFYCKNADYIIAADAGLYLLYKIKIKPDLIIGDMDSIKQSILNKYKYVSIEKYPEDKDYTDSELAIMKARQLNPDNISIFASTGDYLDHSFANIINLFKYQNDKINMELITKNSSVYPVFNKKTIIDKKNHRFSLLPLTKLENLSLKGCKYDFKNKKDISIFDYSISNVITDNICTISFKKAAIIKHDRSAAILILFDKGYK